MLTLYMKPTHADSENETLCNYFDMDFHTSCILTQSTHAYCEFKTFGNF